jgi:hypothetical protein
MGVPSYIPLTAPPDPGQSATGHAELRRARVEVTGHPETIVATHHPSPATDRPSATRYRPTVGPRRPVTQECARRAWR